VKKLLLFIFYFFLFANPTSAFIEVDITRGNLEPLPIAISPFYVEPGSKDIQQDGKIIQNIGEEISKIIVDSRDACLAEAGEIIANKAEIYAEIGEILAGKKKGRENKEEITFFKTVGIAIQDAATGTAILKQAEKKNIGQVIEFD